MAADAGLGDRAFGHLGGAVVRAAGAEVGQPAHRVAGVGQHLGRSEVAHMAEPVERRAVHGEPVREDRHDARGAQLTERREQRRAVGGDFSDHARAGAGPVEQQGLDLLLDHRRFFFDDQYFVQAFDKRVDAGRLERKHQSDLVDADAGVCQIVEREFEPAQHFEEVEVRLADGDDAQRGLGCGADPAVDAVDAGEGAHCVELVGQPGFERQAGQIRPAVVQAIGGRGVVSRRWKVVAHGVEVDRHAALDHFRDRLDADPVAGEA